MTQAISYKSCRLALAVTVYCALAGHALAQSTAEVPKAIFVEVETLYDFDEGSVHSIDDLGIGNRQSAILAALGELRGKYMDLPEAEFAISNAIKGIEEAGQDILSSSEWTTHSNAPFFLNRGIVSTETAAPQTDLAETTFWGQSGADWLAASGGMPGQVTALWSDEGFKARMVQPQSPEEWEVILAALQGKPGAIHNVSASSEIEVAPSGNWVPSPEPTVPVVIIEKSSTAAPRNKGIKRSRDKTIYGVDDRREVFEINWGEAYEWAQGVASIGDRSEAHLHEKGYCTAFLIDTDKAVTNSHCINARDYYSKVLRFRDQYVAEGIPDSIQSYTIAEILVWDVPFDIAILRLNPDQDGEHAGANFPTLPLSGWPRGVDTPLYMIGHPEGHMKKFTPNCKIIRRPYEDEELGKHILGVDCDAFGGNSGSPIFDATTHEVIAFLWGGQLDTQRFDEATEYIHEFAVPLELIANGASFRYGTWPEDVAIALENNP